MPDSPYRPLPEHVTVPLLTLVTRQSLDQDYLTVSERRSERPGERRRSSWVAAVAVLAGFGLLISTAAAQRTRQASADASSRSALIAQLDELQGAVDKRRDRLGELGAAVAAQQSKLRSVTARADTLNAQIRRTQARTGYGAATGPGVRIVVDDAASGLSAQTVRDSDLALLADALWGIGAEAIGINGQRLTPLSAIRNSNVAIHVNGRPLAPPYVVEAIGDVRSMQSAFAESRRGQEFMSLVEGVGLPWSMRNADNLTLVGAPMPNLRWVKAAGPGHNEDQNDGASGSGSPSGTPQSKEKRS